MAKVISIGKQSFSALREQDYFFVDKTNLIKEWWEKGDDITLIARPRRFGKTLNMSMLECFFSNKYANRADLFEGLSIWEEEKYRNLQGTYPVIFLSFASVKAGNPEDAMAMLHEMATTGVAMAVLVTAVWAGMVAVSNVIEKRPVIGAGKEVQ